MGILDDLIASADGSRGTLAIIHGSAGLGKTTLLENFVDQAASAGAIVLRAAGSRNEQNLAYAVLGQLADQSPFGDPRTACPPRAWSADEKLTHIARIAHAALADMAVNSTVAIIVDDMEYADIESLHCLHYIARRLIPIRVVMVLTCGTQPHQPLPPVLQELLYWSQARYLHLSALSRHGVAQILAMNQILDSRACDEAEAETVAEYHRISGGNPLLMHALCGDHEARDSAAERPGGPGVGDGLVTATEVPVPGKMFSQAVLACVHRMGPQAIRIVRSVALLDGAENISQVSRLSDVGVGFAAHVVETLTAVGILEASWFRHAAGRAAILDVIPACEAVQLHYRAARILYDDGESPRRAARHILMAGPVTDEWTVAVLRDAARHSIAERDIEFAVQCLELAAECCSTEPQRLAIKLELAHNYWQVRPAASAQHYLSLKAPILAGQLTGSQSLQVAVGLLWHMRMEEATEVIDHLSADAKDRQLGGDAESRSTYQFLASSFPGAAERLKDACEVQTEDANGVSLTTTPDLVASEALTSVLGQEADDHIIAQAEQVLQGSDLLNASFKSVFPAALCLVYADRLDAAAEWSGRFISAVSDEVAPTWHAVACSYSAMVSFRRGFLDVAVQHGETALSHVRGQERYIDIGLMLATLVEAHTAIGSYQVAMEYLARPVPQELFQTRNGLHYLFARGCHHLAEGRQHAALADFMACGERMVQWNIDSPALVPWRVGAAEAWLSLGQKDQATELIQAQMARLRNGQFRARGITLRACAAVREVSTRPAILLDALRALQRAGDRYETARTLADLSVAYRALGARAEAKTAERRACRIARACHADALHQELVPTYSLVGIAADAGSSYEHGLARLSGSERPVAVLAAQGYTNREISSKLFITVSTVEQHLTRVYRKMEIRSREELPAEFTSLPPDIRRVDQGAVGF